MILNISFKLYNLKAMAALYLNKLDVLFNIMLRGIVIPA